ncbi:MAG: YggS family pyridoxal phosphate-dependent enzyme [Peptococcia bacterium]
MSEIVARITDIRKQIEAACQKAGRDLSEIKLVAVSKNFAPDIILEAYRQGLKVMGENRVQELIHKKDQLPEDIEWHMIGTLQRNKVKDIIGEVAYIHSLDRLALAQEISRQAEKRGITEVKVLLQVNIAEEDSKQGFKIPEVLPVIKEISNLSRIKIYGLMTIAPWTDEPEKVRPIFRQMRELSNKIAELNLPNVIMQELSMGMSNDFPVAIEEGATIIRIGSGIFGTRQY